jgi:predicted acylesterase/phospholipase RssA
MENIALAFSGGGFRAAAYSLGCISYLNKIHYCQKPLLQNVKFISSTSGGSLTNLLYSSFIFNGQSFKAFYDYLNQLLEGDQLLNEALTVLNTPQHWKNYPNKTKNLINAFSIAYDKLFNEKCFELFNDFSNNPHLDQVCVTATDFTNGYLFRFQSQHPTKEYAQGDVGNYYIKFKRTHKAIASKLKLADILAASSCFPSGFEPILFPTDFAHTQITPLQLQQALYFKQNKFTLNDTIDEDTEDTLEEATLTPTIQFGLMDGGITDNQGINSFLRADDRRKDYQQKEREKSEAERKKVDQFDTHIICDVGSHYMDGYTPPKKLFWLIGNFTLFSLLLLFVLCFASFIYAAVSSIYHQKITYPFILGLCLPCIVLGVWLIYKSIKALAKTKKQSGIANILKKYTSLFLNFTINDIAMLVSTRLKSLHLLAEDVYLKQIRRMYYDILRQDKDRFIQNTIYDLSKTKFAIGDISTDYLYPSEAIITVAEKARTMPTTLWFDKTHVAAKTKEAIIATGQFTTCYNLLKHINKMPTKPPLVLALEQLLLSDYEKFNENPFFMQE